MKTKIEALYEEKRTLVAEITKLRDKLHDDEGDGWDSQDEERWDKVNKDYNELQQKIEREQRYAEILKDAEDNTGGGGGDRGHSEPGREDEGGGSARDQAADEEQRALALQAFCSPNSFSLNSEQSGACEALGVDPRATEIDLNLATRYRGVRREFRAMATTAGAGGETIPEGFVNNLEIALLAFGGVRQVSSVIRTAEGNDLPWPTTDDTANEGALIAENAAVTEQDVTTGALVFNAFKYTSKLVKVSFELLQDSAFNLAEILGRLLGERIGRITNRHFTVGTGTGQPKGIVVASVVGKTSAGAGALAADDLIDHLHTVDPAYRGLPGVGWMMHDSIIQAIRKFKESTNQYLWQPGLQAGSPDQLLGAPITINQHMVATITTGDDVALFGMLSKYQIRDVASVRLRRLEERYADNDQVAFVAFTRHDGDLLDAGTNPVKKLRIL